MPRQLWLADVLRSAGLTVVEVPGWQTRGEVDFDPVGLIVHDTGSASWTTSDAGEINVMINGREGLSGPIAQVYLSRTGIWHVVTAGYSHHVKTGWGGPFSGLGNRKLLGIEAQHASAEPWTEAQYRSYVRGVAAICRHTGWKFAAHKEHQPGDKVDPNFDMTTFRRDVAAVLNGAEMPLTFNERAHLDGIFNLYDEVTLDIDAADDGKGELRKFPVPITREVKKIIAAVARLEAKPPVAPAPVDAAALKAALLDPDVLKAIAKAVNDDAHARTAE